MFESAELGRRVSREQYRARSAPLRQELLRLQDRLLNEARRPLLVLLGGVDGGGKSESVQLLNGWMDPRWLATNAYEPPDEVERRHPPFWRYWRDLPPRGRVGLFLSAWYSAPLLERVYAGLAAADFDAQLDQIRRFEQGLADDGAVILKLWMHLSHEAQRRRLENLAQEPLTEARVSEQDWENWRHYRHFVEAAERAIARTDTPDTPWVIIEAEDPEYRALTVAETVRDALRRAMQPPEPPRRAGKASRPSPKSRASHPTVLSRLDMDPRVERADYEEELPRLQAELHRLHLQARARGVASVLVFEGPDAAGKGGAIRRLVAGLEPRYYQVHGVAKPTDEEASRHYLWRFWRRLPADGTIAVFDRSWYGRVLVERVEGFAAEAEWRRAYSEINDFEQQLTGHGVLVLKFWIHITADEQLKRFRRREKTPHKNWKLTTEDWRNRDRWDDYQRAVHDMVQYTSTPGARWILVPGNDKRHARLEVLRHFVQALREAVPAD